MTPAAKLAAALLRAMISLVPPSRTVAMPGYEETEAERVARYGAIAADVAAVALDENERPLPGRTRERTAAQLVGISIAESGFAKDVDIGPCYRGSGSTNDRCGRGASVCILQINVGAGKTAEGWTRAELVADRRKCLRAGLHLARRSFGACTAFGAGHELDAYASGKCNVGNETGLVRLRLGARVVSLMLNASTTGAKGLL